MIKKGASQPSNLIFWKIFSEVCQRESISAVAKAHQMDPSSLSRWIADVESSLGFKLLKRSTRSLAPTEQGMLLSEEMQKIVGRYEDLLSGITHSMNLKSKKIRIVAPPSIVDFLLSRWVFEFAEEEGLIIDLQESTAVSDPSTDAYDVALLTGSSIRPPSIRLGSFSRRMTASPAYLDRYGRPRHPSELAAHRLLRYNGEMRENRLFLRDPDTHLVEALTVNPRMFSNSVSAINIAALDGYGIQLTTPDYVTLGYVDSGRLEPVLTEWEIPDLLVHAVLSPYTTMKPTALDLINFLKRKWAETRGLNE